MGVTPGIEAGGKLDTLLGHCLMRASLQNVKGDSRLAASFAAVRATPKASRVAAFIALWAMALDDLAQDGIGVEAYAEWASESRRTVYRRLSDFRELWPEYDTPNELARLVAAEARRRGEKVSANVQVAL
jgi:hypothetical protein